MSLPSPDTMLARLLVLLFGFTWHELAHATAAWALGDPTPKREGCLTLNPVRHLDPLGSLMLLVTGFGWSKTACLNPARMTRVRSPRVAMAIVAAAGPLANFVLAIAGLVVLHFEAAITPRLLAWGLSPALIEKGWQLFALTVFIEILLAFFNLIPIPPLDGATILKGISPPPIASFIERLEPYGAPIFITLFFVLPYLGLDVAGWMIWTATYRFLSLVAQLGL